MPRTIRYSKSSGALFCLWIAVGCLDPYESPVAEEPGNFLVVDGFLNSEDGAATVKLSRAVQLSDVNTFPAELNAQVQIENEQGNSFPLGEKSEGLYQGIAILVDPNQKYRLIVNTTDGGRYESDYVELKKTPALDSISWNPQEDGVTIYANSHDPGGNTSYYQWVYTETWEYTSKYFSMFKLDNGKAILRSPSEYVYLCWGTESSSQILVGSTAQLSEDVIREFPLTFIPRGSPKLSRRYTVLVQQRALTEETFNYWQALKKTTENLGGLFDPLPSRISGNIRNVKDLSKPALGIFTGGTVQEKRIFIDFYDLPSYLLYIPPSSCTKDSIPVQNISNYGNSTMLGEAYGTPNIVGFTTSSANCLDCRSAGGSLTKPTFWE